MLERGSLDPDIEDAGFALSAEGEVSDVVRSEFGYHIVKLTAFNPPQKPLSLLKLLVKFVTTWHV